MPPTPEVMIQNARDAMAALDDEQRRVVMEDYCAGCYRWLSRVHDDLDREKCYCRRDD